jgi:cytochrome c biogenesis protein CcdA
MIAIEGNFAYSFILGVMAAINPCGFVLLPTYLVYYLGTELNRGEESRAATLRRSLAVGSAVSAGFVGLFLVVGIISRAFTNAIVTNSKYASLVIGIILVAMGVAMFFGWKPPIAQPDVYCNVILALQLLRDINLVIFKSFSLDVTPELQDFETFCSNLLSIVFHSLFPPLFSVARTRL